MPIWNSIKSLLRIENQRDRVEQARMARIQRTHEEDRQQIAAFTLAEYLNLLSDVPLPSAEQKSEFAEFVSAAHSWYKHLPANSPGQAFCFFLDKYAGCDLRLLNGIASPRERRVRGHHHSDIPTAEYRSRFGYLGFSTSKLPAVPRDDGKMYRLPKEILEVGGTRLTAIIHPDSSIPHVWSQLTNWPEESGGRTTLEKIAARCREMQDPAHPKSGRAYFEDQLLDNLFAPERQRQKREVVRSIDRVCEIIRTGRTQPDLSTSR